MANLPKSLFRTSDQASLRTSSRRSSSHFSPLRRTVWEWGFQSRAPSLKHMAVGYGPRIGLAAAPHSASGCPSQQTVGRGLVFLAPNQSGLTFRRTQSWVASRFGGSGRRRSRSKHSCTNKDRVRPADAQRQRRREGASVAGRSQPRKPGLNAVSSYRTRSISRTARTILHESRNRRHAAIVLQANRKSCAVSKLVKL
jgi:hypothetical protein